LNLYIASCGNEKNTSSESQINKETSPPSSSTPKKETEMKTLNATLLAALIAIPAVSFADGGNEPFVNIHSQATASDVRAQLVGARGSYGNNEATAGLIALDDAAPKTREQVRAEIFEARRLGVLQMGEQTVIPTPEQQALITTAGLRALNGTPVAASAAVAALIASPSVSQ
jgi:hypothetical protein